MQRRKAVFTVVYFEPLNLMYWSLIMRGFICLIIGVALQSFDSGFGYAEDVPKGEVTKYTFDQSKIFPGTTRDYWVYVPKQYDPAKPAYVHVNQDGVQFNAPAVFDQLTAAKEMPVTIGVFIMHGRVKAANDQA